MSRCCKNHFIEVLNISDGETIRHSILLIKGRVANYCFKESEIFLHLEERILKTCISRAGEYKFLLDLQSYEASNVVKILKLKFNFCSAERELNVLFKINENCYKIQPIYVVCSDEEQLVKDIDTQSALQIIDLNLRLVQCIYADKLRAAGFARDTFNLNGSCHLFYTSLKCEQAWELSETEIWQVIAEEILTSQWAANTYLKFVAFIACTKYDSAAVVASGDFSYANIRKHLKAHAALGGGGLALFGTAYFYAWPKTFGNIINCFYNQKPIDLALLPDDSNYRRTYGGVYATTLGAICHELGHIFDLGHTIEGVMGNGFDYVNRLFTIDNKTENLPNRIIVEGETTKIKTIQPRLTQVKRQSNSFLEKYHEQKLNDAFYFTRSCALILSKHKWIYSSRVEEKAEIFLNLNGYCIIIESSKIPFKIIEVRRKENSLVENFYEFDDSLPVYYFEVPREVTQNVKSKSHYLFVMVINGQNICCGRD
ncbi:uncharacterized protein LOC119671977 [Teleopsis dalmanni]|uniref:uncharacterized protein LOC119671977 n=1 Tax=Teleopsis dalmanni TaxID=139649 RepID=UPI0018CD2978|nr:uncharacterized protein LOC119671977 [Teleopsis dalmanni]